MKQTLLPVLLAAGLSAQAQINPIITLASAGARIGAGSSGNTRQQKEKLFVVPATFGTHVLVQKRTPANKLPKPGQGGTEIQAIEQLLASRYAALQADSTAQVVSPAQDKEFTTLRTNLEAFNTFWNTRPYSQEMNFYRNHDEMRRRLARQATTR